MRVAFCLVLFLVASPAWAYDPCNGLRHAVDRMQRTNDARLADFQRRLNECNEAVKKAEPQIRALNQGRMPR